MPSGVISLGGGVYRYTREYDPTCEKVKTPPNRAQVTFMRYGDHVLVLRGSFMVSTEELKKELGIVAVQTEAKRRR
jgi:hypothetical protein